MVADTGKALNNRALEAFADNVDWFPDLAHDVVHHALGLCGEAGEVANEVKKFDRRSFSQQELIEKLKGELPDVLVYVFSIAGMFNIDLEEAYDAKRRFNAKRFQSSDDGLSSTGE
jgi:NTP pyrophosphatase (non-canonical NTP hydrolase)